MKTKTYTTKEQAKNAIKWIDNLRYYKKTVGALTRNVNGVQKYCCLGVACKVNGLKYNDNMGYNVELDSALGFKYSSAFEVDKFINGRIVTGLTNANDYSYAKDKGFKNMTKVIKDNIDELFVPEVAKILKKYYKK